MLEFLKTGLKRVPKYLLRIIQYIVKEITLEIAL